MAEAWSFDVACLRERHFHYFRDRGLPREFRSVLDAGRQTCCLLDWLP